MKRYFLLLFCCIWACLIAKADENHYIDSCALCLKENDVKTKRQSFLTGAESYYVKMLNGQEQELSHVLRAVDIYIDYFSTLDYSTVPQWELRALAMAGDGKVDEALAVYDQQNLVDKYTAGSPIYASIERYVMLLQLSGVRQRAREGLAILEHISALNPTSFRCMPFMVLIGYEMHLQGKVDDYLKMFQNRAAKTNDRDMAEVLLFRAHIAYRRNRPNEALSCARTALALFDSIAAVRNEPDYECINRARNYYILGRVYYRLGQSDQCIRAVRSCRDCYAMKEVNNIGLLQRIESLNELAPLAADEGAFFLADSLYQEVDLLGSWLFEGNAYQQSEFAFNSKRLRGIVAYRVGKLDEARSLFDQASGLLDQMEAMSPGQNLEHYQHLFFNIASLYYAEGKIEDALAMNRKVLKIVQESKIPDENRKKLSLAYCHKYVGNCLWALGYQSYLDAKKHKTKDVMQLYREANDNYKQALSYNPKDAEAMAKYNLGELILQGMEKPMAMPKNF